MSIIARNIYLSYLRAELLIVLGLGFLSCRLTDTAIKPLSGNFFKNTQRPGRVGPGHAWSKILTWFHLCPACIPLRSVT